MKFLSAFVIIIMLLPSATYSQQLNEQALDSLLTLDFEAFDQDMRGGWRMYYNEGNYSLAAEVIDLYLTNRNDLMDYQRVVLHFHGGQNYAFADEYDLAIRRFTLAIDTTGVMLNWNPYVEATIAFLKRDRNELHTLRDTIAAGPKNQNGMVPNLDVVESFVVHFDSSCSWAYRNRPNIEN